MWRAHEEWVKKTCKYFDKKYEGNENLGASPFISGYKAGMMRAADICSKISEEQWNDFEPIARNAINDCYAEIIDEADK